MASTGSTGGGPDGACEVREEDSFDVEAVRTWLVAQGTDLTGEIRVRQFGGGASDLTYSLRDDSHDLILRRSPSGQTAKGAHHMGREFRIQDGLAEVLPLVPETVALFQGTSVIGCEFYVGQRVDGVIGRRDLPDGIPLDHDQAHALCTNAIDVLIDLHQIDVDATPLAGMNMGEGYVERQISDWTKRLRDAHTEDVGDYEAVMAWLDEHQPKDVASCLIHNDFRFDNLVLDRDDPTRPVGVHSRDEAVAYYCERTCYSVTSDEWRFYEVYGLFRLGVIAQQIYYRYIHGQTTNEAYAVFGPAARHLEERCNLSIDRVGA